MTGTLNVWVQARFAGVLAEHEGNVTFTYDDAYRADRRSPALSVSMPKIRVVHDGNVARRWIGNLLPDNDDVRERWAKQFGERRDTGFNLLRHMGQDCAGAVQVLPVDLSPDTAGEGVPVSDDEIEARLRALRIDDSDWTFGDHGGRWSLGGAQGKFALAQQPDGTWVDPTGRAASTHIFKVGVHRFAHADVAEFVTMRIAAGLGLPVARTDVRRYGDETALVSVRYDRTVVDDVVVRLHQEDLCQAFGLSRTAKYESDGGPGVAEIAGLIDRAVDPRDAPAARLEFLAALLFNWAVAGSDAHAKNYSLLHAGPRVSMAPLYDLTSAAPLVSKKEVQYETRLAMKMGRHYKLRDIASRHLVQTGELLGFDPGTTLDLARRQVAELPAAIDAAMADIAEFAPDDVRSSFRDGLLARAASAERTLR